MKEQAAPRAIVKLGVCAGLEAHGIWGHPEQVIDGVNRHIDAGCTTFVIEFFGRDTRLPAKIFAETVLPAFR